jgi:GNAT superfamily N-acetyltransferase
MSFPTPTMFEHRLANTADLPALRNLALAAIDELQRDVLNAEQIAASHAIMGIDSRLVEDRTYFVVEQHGELAGCGGWSRRSTLYGGDHTTGRNDRLLDPDTEPARVRAMYTHPGFARRGVGRLVLSLCEEAAASEGFRTLELMATMARRRRPARSSAASASGADRARSCRHRFIARGLQTKQVAHALGISVKTADRHIQNAYRKIGISARATAALFAMEHDLVTWGEFPIGRHLDHP